MCKMLPLVLASMLTLPSIATPESPSAQIQVDVSKANRGGDTRVLDTGLVDHDANIEAKDHAGNTALTYASNMGGTEYGYYARLVVWLLERGANTEAKNNYGKTALIYAANCTTILKR